MECNYGKKVQNLRQESNNRISLSFIFLILVIIGLVIYIIYDKKTNNENINGVDDNNVGNEKLDAKQLDISLEIVKKLDNMVKLKSTVLDVQGYFYSKDKILASDVNNQIKLIIGGEINNELYGDENMTFISVSQMDSAIKSVFGSDVTYINEDINDPCHHAIYDATNQKYILEYGCGGTLLPFFSDSIVKAEQTSDTINIYKKVLYVELSETNEEGVFKKNIYKPNKSKLIKTINFEQNIEDYYSEGDTFMFIFKKEKESDYFSNENYKFYSVEKID